MANWLSKLGIGGNVSVPTPATDPIARIRAARPVDLYRDHKSGLDEATFRERCRGQVIFHCVDLGDLFIEGKRKNSDVLAHETELMDWPDVRGKTVLDIGAWSGWFSVEAERRGAKSVTAIDYYSWAVDWPKMQEWMRAERRAGRTANHYAPPAYIIDETRQPGRIVFDITRENLGSKVTPILTTAEEFESEPFDLVLYLGVLYHTENPFASLRHVASLTRDHLIVETLGMNIPGNEDRAAWQFFGDASLTKDITTRWVPNEKGLADMLKAVGFSRVEFTHGMDRLPASGRKSAQPIRIWAHAWK